MKYSPLLFLLPLTALAQFQPPPAGYEEPPTLSATEILRPEFAAGPGFKVREVVPTWGGRNGYMIDSDYGIFEADGNAMLVHRVREIAAISRLREISRTEEYKNALVSAAKSPIVAAKQLIEQPAKTITGVPKGLWKTLNRVGQGVKEAASNRQRSDYEDSSAEELIGFSKAKRALAVELGVDPYSSNEALQRELNSIAWTAYAGKATFRLATLPVSGGAGMALTATNITTDFESALRDKSPTDLRISNQKALLAMGCSRPQVDSFLSNPAFSPSAQTAIVINLQSMAGVKGRAGFVKLANDVTSGEGDALFFCETSRILAQLHANSVPLAQIDILQQIPVAVAKDGRPVVALEWDCVAWTQRAADFIALHTAMKAGKTAPKNLVIAISGDATPLAQQKLKDSGVTLVTRISPGPLK